MIRRAFIRALSGAILTTLLGVKAWRLEDEQSEEYSGFYWKNGELWVTRDVVPVPITASTFGLP